MTTVLTPATPLTAATVWIPDSVPLAGLVPIAIVTVPVKLVAMLPNASRAATRTAGAMIPPAGLVLGCTLKLICVGTAPGVPVSYEAKGRQYVAMIASHGGGAAPGADTTPASGMVAFALKAR